MQRSFFLFDPTPNSTLLHSRLVCSLSLSLSSIVLDSMTTNMRTTTIFPGSFDPGLDMSVPVGDMAGKMQPFEALAKNDSNARGERERERRYAEREAPGGFGFFALALALDHPTRMVSDGAKPHSCQVRMPEGT